MNKKFLVLLLTLVLCLFVTGCKKPSLSLEETSVNLTVGDSYEIKPVLVDIEGDVVTYDVADKTLLSVQGNVITALKAGKTTVEVYLTKYPEQKASLEVIIKEAPHVVVTGENVVYATKEIQLQATLVELEGEIIWESSDKTVAIVDDNGLVKAIKAGTVTISAFCGDHEGTLQITVKPMPILDIEGEEVVGVGKEIELEAIGEHLEEAITWETSDASVATVVDGKVVGIKAGTVTITAKSGLAVATKEIKVTDVIVVITGNPSVFIGETTTLVANVESESDKGPYTYIWKSDDEGIATVDANGVVKGIQEGSVTIIATYKDAVGTFVIDVTYKKEVLISGDVNVDLGDTSKLEASLVNLDGTITWSSSDESVATVDANGVVTGVKLGKATISATCEGYTGTIEVEVIPVADKVTYYHEGGSSPELYASEEKIASFDLTSYNSLSGSFWGGGYANYIYITTKAGDPGATFSDRIYIGKNEYTGYYEIKGLLLAGTSKWVEGSEYVITISSSYSGYRAVHSQVQKLSVGDVVIINTNKISTIKKSNPAPCSFYKPEIKGEKVVVAKEDWADTLITPVRLGYDFLGWFDANGNVVESLTKDQISGNVKLYAKWMELNPVTDMTVNQIPSEMNTDDTFQIVASVVPSDAFFTQVLYSTSNKDIISVTEEGLLKAVNAGKATITVRDFLGKVVKTYEIVVYSIPSLDIKFPATYNGVLDVNEILQLEPSYLGKAVDGLTFTYSSSDSAVLTVDSTGLVKAVANGSAIITIKTSNDITLEVGITVTGLSEADKVEQVLKLLVENSLPEIEVGNACLYNDSTNRYYVATYGSVNRFLFEDLVIDTKYQESAKNSGVHSGLRDELGIQFVTVHDTATLSNTSEAIAKNMSQVGANASIHYVVGNEQVWGCLPEEYIAWHAGDGTGVKFEWLPSGIKGEAGVQPEFDLVKEGTKYYFTINGQKTNVECPISNGSKTIQNPSKAHFSRLGPTWTVINGEYHIGTPWASFGQVAAGVISSKGGNRNSVGIEMCVNQSGDIYDSYQRNAKLVADILYRNNLDLTRVKQHNTFDGKNCPQVLIAGNYWTEFMEMVAINYILQKDYSDVKVSMKSDDTSIIADNGRVVNPPKTATTVGYTITVTSGSTTKSIKLYTVVPGTTSWEQWNGTYKASIIWNDGNFVLK